MVLGLVVLVGWYCTLKWMMGCCFWLLRFRLWGVGFSGGVLDLGYLYLLVLADEFGFLCWWSFLVVCWVFDLGLIAVIYSATGLLVDMFVDDLP